MLPANTTDQKYDGRTPINEMQGTTCFFFSLSVHLLSKISLYWIQPHSAYQLLIEMSYPRLGVCNKALMSHCLGSDGFLMAAVVLCEKVHREVCEHCSVRFGDLPLFLV